MTDEARRVTAITALLSAAPVPYGMDAATTLNAYIRDTRYIEVGLLERACQQLRETWSNEDQRGRPPRAGDIRNAAHSIQARWRSQHGEPLALPEGPRWDLPAGVQGSALATLESAIAIDRGNLERAFADHGENGYTRFLSTRIAKLEAKQAAGQELTPSDWAMPVMGEV